MTQRLHLVFGGELVDPQKNVFRDVSQIHIVGMFPNYESPSRPGRARRSARSTTPTCAISSPISTACATRRSPARRPRSWATEPWPPAWPDAVQPGPAARAGRGRIPPAPRPPGGLCGCMRRLRGAGQPMRALARSAGRRGRRPGPADLPGPMPPLPGVILQQPPPADSPGPRRGPSWITGGPRSRSSPKASCAPP
jgi:hypothetical protein